MMKYYSEILDEVFDTPEELKQAENACKDKDECDIASEEKEAVEKTLSKKELADKVAKCDETLTEAYKLLSVAEKKAEELSKEYLEKVDALMGEANNRVKEAEKARYIAIKNFNDAYGVYKVSYSGSKAAEELERAWSRFANSRSWLDDLFKYL